MSSSHDERSQMVDLKMTSPGADRPSGRVPIDTDTRNTFAFKLFITVILTNLRHLRAENRASGAGSHVTESHC